MSKSISLPYLQNVGAIKIHKPSKSIKSLKESKSAENSPKLSSPNNSKDIQNSFDLRSPREEFKRGSCDSSPTLVGLPAKLDFVNTYRNRLKITEKTSFEGKETSPSIAYLEMIDKVKLKPMTFGIVRPRGKESDLNIPGFSMGDNYAQAFSEGIKRCKSLEKINLKANRLSEKGLMSIIGKLEIENIKHLCLSDNIISFKVVKQISEILIDSKCILKVLILESTKLTDLSATLIFESLALNSFVSHVNLARNSLTDGCCRTLASMLSLNSSLKKLDLHWNQLTGSGCGVIFEGLAKNKRLKELDLSWNLMSRDIESSGIAKIAAVLKKQEKLKHLDFSSNYLTSDQCLVLAEGLEKNHSIFGIHMVGNDCHVDSRGFIVSDAYVSKVEQGHVRNRIFSEKKVKSPGINNCWICEQWVEMKFCWNGEISEPVCIHLECDDFQPDVMERDGDAFSITRVVPPGKIRFFFSINLVIVKDKNVKVVRLATPVEKEIVFWNSTKVNIFINNLNQLEVKGKPYASQDLFSILPRTPKLKFQPQDNQLEKIVWKYSASLFKDYHVDDQDLISDCFDFDWRHSRIPNLTPESIDLDYLRSLLKSFYKVIKDAYRVLSSYSNSEVPSISANQMAELLSSCKVFDDHYNITDLGVNWNSVLLPSVKNQHYNPGNALVRYEFLELLPRIARDKYIRKKICLSLAEATERLLNDHLLPKFESLASSLDPWRKTYHCEIVDVTLKAHKALLEDLFKRFSGNKTLPGEKKFMSLDEFRMICVDGGLVGGKLNVRDVDVCFYLAVMTQVDELFKKRHTEMKFCEFLEAFTRAADVADLKQQSDEMLLGSKETGLQVKLENAFHRVIKLCSESLQESFVFPTEKTYEKLMFRSKGVVYRSTTLNLLDVSY